MFEVKIQIINQQRLTYNGITRISGVLITNTQLESVLQIFFSKSFVFEQRLIGIIYDNI